MAQGNIKTTEPRQSAANACYTPGLAQDLDEKETATEEFAQKLAEDYSCFQASFFDLFAIALSKKSHDEEDYNNQIYDIAENLGDEAKSLIRKLSFENSQSIEQELIKKDTEIENLKRLLWAAIRSQEKRMLIIKDEHINEYKSFFEISRFNDGVNEQIELSV